VQRQKLTKDATSVPVVGVTDRESKPIWGSIGPAGANPLRVASAFCQVLDAAVAHHGKRRLKENRCRLVANATGQGSRAWYSHLR